MILKKKILHLILVHSRNARHVLISYFYPLSSHATFPNNYHIFSLGRAFIIAFLHLVWLSFFSYIKSLFNHHAFWFFLPFFFCFLSPSVLSYMYSHFPYLPSFLLVYLVLCNLHNIHLMLFLRFRGSLSSSIIYYPGEKNGHYDYA